MPTARKIVQTCEKYKKALTLPHASSQVGDMGSTLFWKKSDLVCIMDFECPESVQISHAAHSVNSTWINLDLEIYQIYQIQT